MTGSEYWSVPPVFSRKGPRVYLRPVGLSAQDGRLYGLVRGSRSQLGLSRGRFLLPTSAIFFWHGHSADFKIRQVDGPWQVDINLPGANQPAGCLRLADGTFGIYESGAWHYEYYAKYVPQFKAMGLEVIPLIALSDGMTSLHNVLRKTLCKLVMPSLSAMSGMTSNPMALNCGTYLA